MSERSNSNRTHEECDSCLFLEIVPSPCDYGHPLGPVSCPHRKNLMNVIYNANRFNAMKELLIDMDKYLDQRYGTSIAHDSIYHREMKYILSGDYE